MSSHDLSAELAVAARALQSEVGPKDTLDRVVSLAIEMVDGCEYAGISMNQNGKIRSPATSDPIVERVDELQYEYDQGPCIEAIRHQHVVHSRELSDDSRWPTWGPRTAEETGIRSMMCFRLFTVADTLGALNLYSTKPASFDARDLETGTALAAHSALAVAATQKIENLGIALDSRTVIGQAVGIIMERFDMDPDPAFAVLNRLSQHLNRKLRDIAQELVTTRKMPTS